VDSSSALLTDLYQLTMLQGYFEQRMDEIAVFEFFVRKLPDERGFLMAAGLEQLLCYLEDLHFKAAELDYLKGAGRFSNEFVDHLATLRFSGDVHAMAEGTLFFANEPIVRITAPIAQAQLIESRAINLLQFQTLIASKAARCVLVAPNKLLVDFGMRRAHGNEAALLAEPLFGVPLFGTMAHSFVQAYESEMQSFEQFAHTQPNNKELARGVDQQEH
jgi:nicotinate phosphoribosyltransferase